MFCNRLVFHENSHYIAVDLCRVPPQGEDEPTVCFPSSVGSLSSGFLMGAGISRLDAQFSPKIARN